jgi:hypothetical protein
VAPLTESVAVSPAHIVGEFTEITGILITVTVIILVLVQPLMLVPVNVYVVVTVGENATPSVIPPVHE